MARLLNWPIRMPLIGFEPLSGPRAVSGSAGTSIDNFTQTTASAFGMWRYRFDFGPMRGDAFRRFRGWVAALHGGANATRVPRFDPDTMSFADAGVAGKPVDQTWSNGANWDNGRRWQMTRPIVPVAAASTFDTSIIYLGSEWWGHSLDIGDEIGFFPFHLGKYVVTEARGAGEYRIWPPLRKAIAATDYATFDPVMAMRMEGQEAAKLPRAAVFSEGASITLVETFDYDVRTYFAE